MKVTVCAPMLRQVYNRINVSDFIYLPVIRDCNLHRSDSNCTIERCKEAQIIAIIANSLVVHITSAQRNRDRLIIFMVCLIRDLRV